jgi:PGF-pre-PGF domain-containing protein
LSYSNVVDSSIYVSDYNSKVQDAISLVDETNFTLLESNSCDYLPVNLGKTWFYKWNNSVYHPDPIKSTVYATSYFDGQYYLYENWTHDGINNRGCKILIKNTERDYWSSFSGWGDSLSQFPRPDYLLTDYFFYPRLFLKYPLYVGKIWNTSEDIREFHGDELETGTLNATTIVESEELVTTQYGTFNSLKIKTIIESDDDFISGIRYIWVAENYGIVKLEYHHSDGSITTGELVGIGNTDYTISLSDLDTEPYIVEYGENISISLDYLGKGEVVIARSDTYYVYGFPEDANHVEYEFSTSILPQISWFDVRVVDENGIVIAYNHITLSYQGYQDCSDTGSDGKLDNIIVVDQSGNCPSIQWAVDNATAGDTIIVRDGIYYENVVVDKTLTIRSENGSDNCIIEPIEDHDCIFYIIGNSINISGFKIINKQKFSEGICLYEATDSNVSGNIVEGGEIGIHLTRSEFNVIANNIVRSNYEGIELESSENNTIENNHFTSNLGSGLFLYKSLNNTILDNEFVNSGLFVYNSYNNLVEDNTVNSKPLVYLENESDTVVDDAGQVVLIGCNNITVENLNLSYTNVGVELFETDASKILNNDLNNNTRYGVYLYNSTNNEINSNNASHNIWFGICLFNSNDNLVISSSLENNGWFGLYLYTSSNNTISKNNVVDNYFDGIQIRNSLNNTISSNDVSRSIWGIYLTNSVNNRLIDNSIMQNTDGIVIQEATDNYIEINRVINNLKWGMSIENCNGISITGNNASMNGYDGIHVEDSYNVNIKDNTIFMNDDGIELHDSFDNVISGNIIKYNYESLELDCSENNTIADNYIANSRDGIELFDSLNNTIINNTCYNCSWYAGIYLYNSNDNNIRNNNFSKNEGGISLLYSNHNTIYLNNFINNAENVYSYDSVNIWNSTEPLTYTYNGKTSTNYLGNYWSGYTDTDFDGDGIWDNPFVINSENQDEYPLVDTFENYIIGAAPSEIEPVASFTFSPSSPNVGETVTFDASASYDPDGGDIESYSWDFGDGNTGSGKIVTYIYSSAGTYTVALTITDDEGQTSYTSKTVSIGTTSTVLTLNQPPTSVNEDEEITFIGTLKTSSGIGISGSTIKIFEDDGTSDELLAQGTTGSDGSFSITWTAEKKDADDTIEVYAKFEGDSNYGASTSSVYTIIINEEPDAEEPSKVTLTVRVHNVYDTLPPGGGSISVNLLDSANSVIDQKKIYYDGGEQYVEAQFNIEPGDYIIEVYQTPETGIGYIEFWGSSNVNVENDKEIDFKRNTLVIQDLKINGQSLYSSPIIDPPPSGEVNFEITVKNYGDSATNAYSWLFIDKEKSFPYDIKKKSETVSIAPGDTATFTITVNLESFGTTYYIVPVVYGEYDSWRATNQTGWLEFRVNKLCKNLGVAFVDVKLYNNGNLVEENTTDLNRRVCFSNVGNKFEFNGKIYDIDEMPSSPIFIVFFESEDDNIKVRLRVSRDSDGMVQEGVVDRLILPDKPIGYRIDVLSKEDLAPIGFRINPSVSRSIIKLSSIIMTAKYLTIKDPITGKINIDDKAFSSFEPFLNTPRFFNPRTQAWLEGSCGGMAITSILFNGIQYESDRYKIPLNYDYLRSHNPEYVLDCVCALKNAKDECLYYCGYYSDEVIAKISLPDGSRITPLDNVYLPIIIHQEKQDKIMEEICSFNNVLTELKFERPVIIGIFTAKEVACHAVIAFGYIKSGNDYYFAVYDPNHPERYNWLRYNIIDYSVDYPDNPCGENVRIRYFKIHALKYNAFSHRKEKVEINDLLSNYKIYASDRKLYLYNSGKSYTGQFISDKFYSTNVPYSAGFMEYSKKSNGEVDLLYVLAYPSAFSMNVDTQPVGKNNFDPVTILNFSEDKVDGVSLTSPGNITINDTAEGYIIYATDWLSMERYISDDEKFVNITLNITGTNITIYFENEVFDADIDSDGSIDITLQPPTPNFTFFPDKPEKEQLIKFNASSSYDPDGNIISYYWNFGNGTNATGSAVNHTYTSPGIYTVTLTVTDNDGINASLSKMITVNSPPIASFTYTPPSPLTGQIITFNASSSYDDGNITSYYWNFGDGSNATGMVVDHTYSSAGTYTVTLEVEDDLGFLNSTSVNITINKKETSGKLTGGGGGGGGLPPVVPLIAESEYSETFMKNLRPNQQIVIEMPSRLLSDGIAEIGATYDSSMTVRVTVSKVASLPSTIIPPKGKVYSYFEIVFTDYFTSAKIEPSGYVKFRISKDWLKSGNAEKSDVKFLKWKDGKWVELSSKLIDEDDSYYYFKVELDSFSLFAVLAKEKISLPSIPSIPAPTLTATEGVVETPTATPTSKSTAPLKPVTPISTEIIIVIAVIIIVFAIVVYAAKRGR